MLLWLVPTETITHLDEKQMKQWKRKKEKKNHKSTRDTHAQKFGNAALSLPPWAGTTESVYRYVFRRSHTNSINRNKMGKQCILAHFKMHASERSPSPWPSTIHYPISFTRHSISIVNLNDAIWAKRKCITLNRTAYQFTHFPESIRIWRTACAFRLHCVGISWVRGLESKID